MFMRQRRLVHGAVGTVFSGCHLPRGPCGLLFARVPELQPLVHGKGDQRLCPEAVSAACYSGGNIAGER